MPSVGDELAAGDGEAAGVGLSLGDGEISGDVETDGGDVSGDGVTAGVVEALGLNTVGSDSGAAGVTLGSACGDATATGDWLALGISAVPMP